VCLYTGSLLNLISKIKTKKVLTITYDRAKQWHVRIRDFSFLGRARVGDQQRDRDSASGPNAAQMTVLT
jgi:hypothetical protein